MRSIIALALTLSALWTSDHSAVIQWTQTQRSCLSVRHASGQGVFVGCYSGVGRVTVSLGKVGPLSGDLRPMAGDVYCVTGLGCAPLQSITYLPAIR